MPLMPPRIDTVTLAVSDLPLATACYREPNRADRAGDRPGDARTEDRARRNPTWLQKPGPYLSFCSRTRSRRRFRQLAGNQTQLEHALVASDRESHRDADALADQHSLQVVHAIDGLAVDGHDQIAPLQAGLVGGQSRDDLDDLDAPVAAELAGQPRRQRPRAAADAEVGAADAAIGDQRRDDAPACHVDRNGQAQSDAGDGRVDADHSPAPHGDHARRHRPPEPLRVPERGRPLVR